MVIIMKKCIIASILALMLSLTTFAQATALPETKINDWAVPDVGRAARRGLLTDTRGTLHASNFRNSLSTVWKRPQVTPLMEVP